MTEALPLVYLARHGETAWSLSGQHTGRTDLPLTGRGEDQARALGERLHGLVFAKVLTSPSRRAVRTCALAGFGATADTDPDLAEWDYGAYEGLTSEEIQQDHPGWTIFGDGAPGGETIAQVAGRAQSVIARAVGAGGDVALFAHGHILRILAACWLELPPDGGRYFALSPAGISTLGYEHIARVITRWNLT